MLVKKIRIFTSIYSLVYSSLLFLGAQSFSYYANAEESVSGQVQDATGDIVTGTKKKARGVKKKIRDNTGNESIKEDFKDGAKNVGDDISNSAGKTKRKIKEKIQESDKK